MWKWVITSSAAAPTTTANRWSGRKRKLARLSAALLPDFDDLRPEKNKQTLELQETMWSEIADDETPQETCEIAEEEETLPEIHVIAAETFK